MPLGVQDLGFLTTDKPPPPAVEAQSLSTWTTRSNLKGKFQKGQEVKF